MDAQSINTFVEETNGAESAEHVRAMLDKAEQIEANNNPDSDERPDWLPEKFSSVEQMAQAYSELEKKLGRGEKIEEEESGEGFDLDEVVSTSVDDVEALITENGLSFDVLQNEFLAYGTLTKDSFEDLEAAGFPRPVVETWIQGQNAVADNLKTSVQSLAGGAENYSAMLEWAGENLNDREIGAFNKAIESGNVDDIGLAVNGIMSKFSADAEPTLMRGGTGTVSANRFNSTAELTAAMGDPKYHKDSAYREKVSKMLANSSLF